MIAQNLTVIIPAYNEEPTIVEVLGAVVKAPFSKQLIVVDDGSSDGTPEAIRRWIEQAGPAGPDYTVEVVRHEVNRGKGAAIRSGLTRARCPITLVQDADLEYDPGDYSALLGPILAGKADVVYGSRYLHPENCLLWTPNRVCVAVLNAMVLVFYGNRITDEATCYKAFRTDDLRRMDLCCDRFEFCPEVTAKACRMGLVIAEVPVRYSPRSHREGKKIGWRDGVEAILTLLRWRFAPFRPGVASRGSFSGPRELNLADPRATANKS